jgi:hypothetical protein
MRKPYPVMKTIRLWAPLTRDLFMMAANGCDELMNISAQELEELRQQAACLAIAVESWQATNRPQKQTPTNHQERA